ncbi:MAG: hypothetical protein A3A80_04205 [Candidatus Terrybacteria bacterium RIFCSPLOWO2_01_FULL_44_24]|uniref:Dihydrofolate reductase n=1 Tax=Candidatus Terrybacteria bacterium RIFCSPHIGHO2_01_FULL_43_35 TaxID=1802361 RepID=A0A1G2PD67_9BACT|nr:MAG: hypothetical protein A2828_00710 [Candidatus Terrybacteria bacterium RIFCSPHIGHO2_01_FULL_43_35]OHA50207.1 MAG: hypothetical protein A3B75_01790 [Candidatus Terrybacteria bacterium RIFCSPHIGHO2_02_FULL_43_14]OHA51266.1 MAG: hypothetical protein A3A80_04205 [Candidatus Terrybacteria bacterium RIFCSPLOWO2_01_FULL_44_24]
MIISVIVAFSRNRVIGNNNTLPWHLPEDLKRFRELTYGHTVIMGRKTHESIGKVLPGRTNIIITSKEDYKAEGCIIAGSLDEAIKIADGDSEVFIIGGANVYKQAMAIADRLYVTFIKEEFEGDAFFPEINEDIWQIRSKTDYCKNPMDPYNFSFITYVRREKN